MSQRKFKPDSYHAKNSKSYIMMHEMWFCMEFINFMSFILPWDFMLSYHQHQCHIQRKASVKKKPYVLMLYGPNSL